MLMTLMPDMHDVASIFSTSFAGLNPIPTHVEKTMMSRGNMEKLQATFGRCNFAGRKARIINISQQDLFRLR